ncbi:hypothetical protein WJX73_005145 [Symbiochloris irregularis]|uniref:Uncharacterized protein n=1 Tax=Symbiochloris irregularis TaxID=706552 RepID=A0AAW1P819_9CHLO
MSADEDCDIDPQQLPTPKFVGTGVRGFLDDPDNPQAYLEGSNHPYAPFPGNALKWESFVFADGTSYEGLMREGIPHMKGNLVIGNGTGGGMDAKVVQRGDKYEGEFNGGFVEGLGMHTSVGGEVYKGQYALGKRHGCGMTYNLAPLQRLLSQGVEPDKAWERVGQRIQDRIVYGRWYEDERVDRAPAEFGKPCSIPEIKLMARAVDSVVTRARMFAYKPDGQATIMMLQDATGIPIPVMQDPLHYPHGTRFLAPGPLGQCHPLPDDEHLKEQMRLHARNTLKIHNAYNIPYKVQPGSDLDKAIKHHEQKQTRLAEVDEDENEAEQRRLERFARLQQKRRGGMRGGWRPEANTLGLNVNNDMGGFTRCMQA